MPLVSVDQAAPGMVLSNPVTDRRGRLLIPAGQTLSDKHVNALKMWGVVSLDIEGDEDVQIKAPISSEALEAARAALAPLYRHADVSHPFVRKVFEHAAHQRAQDLVNETSEVPSSAPAVDPAPVGASQ